MDRSDIFPFVVFANKSDLSEQISISTEEIEAYAHPTKTRVFFGAKTGNNIEEGFIYIANEFLRIRDEVI